MPSEAIAGPPGLDAATADEVAAAARWARWPAYLTLAGAAMAQPFDSLIVDPFLDPAVPFDPDLLDALLPAVFLTPLATAAAHAWRRNRRLLAGPARRSARRACTWAAVTALVDGVAALLLWAAWGINITVA